MTDFRPTFHWLSLEGVRVDHKSAVPRIIAPLVEAVEEHGDLVPVVTSIVRSLGFDAFMYGLSTARRPGQDNVMYTFATAPREWAVRWDQAAYVEVDPRIQFAFESILPFFWDQLSERGKSARLDRFLDDACGFGQCSGVSFVLPDRDLASVVMCFNSSEPIIDDARRTTIDSNLGSMLTFGYYFHEFFMKQIVRAGMPPHFEGAPLSPRERQCLTYAARGLTTEDIASKLGIKPRTAQFHFDSIRTKLAVATRQEAVARAMQQHLIDVYR
jgi:LuxR family transcriptional regulator, activator of conjugal transfer of Ti plasmids